MMVGNLDEGVVEEEDSVEEKKDVEEARVKVIRAGLDAMIVERLDIFANECTQWKDKENEVNFTQKEEPALL